MKIQELAKRYELNKNDFWELPMRKGTWILKHDACVKIQHIENIKLVSMELPLSEIDNVCVMVTMSKPTKDGEDIIHTSLGEANNGNCQNKYKFAVAQKRAIDRCVLQLISAYEYGIYSQSEADDFDVVEKTIKHTEQFLKLLMFDKISTKMRREWIARWSSLNNYEQIDAMLFDMAEFIKKEKWDTSKKYDPSMEDETLSPQQQHLNSISMEGI